VVEDWYAQHTSREIGAPVAKGEPVRTPAKVGSLLLPNRIVHEQTATHEANDGLPNLSYFDKLKKLSQSGAGLIMTDLVAAAPAGRQSLGSPGLYRDAVQEAWTEVLEQIRELGGATVGLQLGYVHAMGVELEQVRAAFEAATSRAAAAGFGLLQLDMTQGSLLGSFLSPCSNQRQDQYGGSLENRLRYPLAVLKAVRALWPAEKPLAAAITVADESSAQEAVAIAKALKEAGCDLLRIDPRYTGADLGVYGEQIRAESGIAVMYDHRSGAAGSANTMLAASRSDLAVLPHGKARAEKNAKRSQGIPA
jgi:anthraniloyl-CoA monooxygenase